jgi:hypothetical protein
MMRRRARRASGAMTMTELRQKEKEAAVAVEAKEKRVGGDVRTSATATATATVESNNAASTKDAAADCLPIVYQSTIAADVDNAVVGPGPGVEVLEKGQGQEGAMDAAFTASRVLAASAATAAVKAARQQPAVMRQPKLRTQIRKVTKVAKVRPMVMRRDGPATTLPLRPAGLALFTTLFCRSKHGAIDDSQYGSA